MVTPFYITPSFPVVTFIENQEYSFPQVLEVGKAVTCLLQRLHLVVESLGKGVVQPPEPRHLYVGVAYLLPPVRERLPDFPKFLYRGALEPLDRELEERLKGIEVEAIQLGQERVAELIGLGTTRDHTFSTLYEGESYLYKSSCLLSCLLSCL